MAIEKIEYTKKALFDGNLAELTLNVELPLSPRDLLMKQLANRVGSLHLWQASATSTALSGLLGPMREAAQELGSMQDPGHIYMRCVACGLVR